MAAYFSDQAAPARGWVAVTPHDSTNLPAGCRGIFVGTAGNIALVNADGTAVTFSNIANATFIPCGPIRVNSTNTTASNIVALY